MWSELRNFIIGKDGRLREDVEALFDRCGLNANAGGPVLGTQVLRIGLALWYVKVFAVS